LLQKKRGGQIQTEKTDPNGGGDEKNCGYNSWNDSKAKKGRRIVNGLAKHKMNTRGRTSVDLKSKIPSILGKKYGSGQQL